MINNYSMDTDTEGRGHHMIIYDASYSKNEVYLFIVSNFNTALVTNWFKSVDLFEKDSNHYYVEQFKIQIND